jgi:hypothetical protein
MVNTLDVSIADERPGPDTDVDVTKPDDTADGERRAWYRAVGVGLAAFVASRIIVLAATYASAQQEFMEREQRGLPVPGSVRGLMERVLVRWDGRWYLIIAEHGYQSELPERIGYIRDFDGAAIAFYPLYPYLARWFDYVFPGGLVHAMLGLNFLLGAVAVVLVGMLARQLYSVDTAQRAMVLFTLFPGSVVLSWNYAEATLIVCAAACMLFLLRERWELAGIMAALGTAARPNGIALVAACAAAAAIAIYRKRQWRSLLSVGMSPLGAIGYHWYLRVHTGERWPWMRAQKEAWNEGWSWGATAVRYIWRFLQNPLGTGFGDTYMQAFVAVTALGIGLFCSVRKRLPWLMLAYVVVVAALMLSTKVVEPRPRFVFTAFPLVIGVAAWWPRRFRGAWDGLVVLSAGSLVAFATLYASFAAIP